MEEKIKRLKELIQEIDRIESLLYLYEGDRIDLEMAKREVFEILRTL